MIIQFSHANGFPARSYRKLFGAWRNMGHRVFAVEQIGHDPAYPVSDGWPHLCAELVAALDGHDEPVVLIGHSLGGMLSVMAAYARPHKVSAVVLLDSPIVSRARAWALWLMKRSRLDIHFSPAGLTQSRRIEWPSAAEAYRHFESKPLFRAFDPECLGDYVAGFVTDENASQGQVRLGFDRAIETSIYRTLPHHLHRLVCRPLVDGERLIPIGFLGGTHSPELRQLGTRATRKLVGTHFTWVEGGHLFPLERPLETAFLVERTLARMLGREAGRGTDSRLDDFA